MRWSDEPTAMGQTDQIQRSCRLYKPRRALRFRPTICMRAASATSAPPRIAPVIIPGIEMRPTLLTFGSDLTKYESRRTSSRPSLDSHAHLVHGRQKTQFQSLPRQRKTSFHSTGPESQIDLDFVLIVRHLFGDVVCRHGSPTYCVSSDHAPAASSRQSMRRLQNLMISLVQGRSTET